MGSLLDRQYILKAFFIIVVLFVSTSSFAKGNQYEFEVFAAYSNTEDEQSASEFEQAELGISIYDLPVVYGDYPYLLTNFFERRTHLDLIYTNSESDTGNNETSGDFYKINYSFASVGYPALFNVGAGRYVGEGTDNAGDYDLDGVFYFFGFGYYVSANSVAKVELTAIDYELTDDVPPGQDLEYDETHLDASWQHVLKIDTDRYISVLLDVEAIEVGSSKNSRVGGSFDYFVNKKVGFGIGYTAHRGDLDITEGDELVLSASAFMDEQFGFTAEVSRLFADQSDSDEDNFFLKAIARFK